MTLNWRHRDEWKYGDNKTYLVVVSRHTIGDDNVWAMYVYLYPAHPAFSLCKPDGGIWGQPNFDMHSYTSFFKVHRDDGGQIVSFQIGHDYNHDGDWRYTQMRTMDDASSIFWDAERLIEQVENWRNEG